MISRRSTRLAGLSLGALALATATSAMPVLAQVSERGQAAIDKAMAVMAATYPDRCGQGIESPEMQAPEVHEISYRYDFEDESDDERTWQLVALLCGFGAYNVQTVYYLIDEYDELTPVQFAVPSFDIGHEDPEDYESAITSLDISGFHAKAMMVNSEFNPNLNAISEFSHWRGLGDASSIGEWRFENGEFVLHTYMVDPSYDGEMNHYDVVVKTVPVADPFQNPVQYDLDE